jgi:hypothetical protein
MPETTKVKHLVAALLQCDQEALVFTEGCDCIGDAEGLSVKTAGEVLITRSPSDIVLPVEEGQ